MPRPWSPCHALLCFLECRDLKGLYDLYVFWNSNLNGLYRPFRFGIPENNSRQISNISRITENVGDLVGHLVPKLQPLGIVENTYEIALAFPDVF